MASPQLFDGRIPLSTNVLALFLEFDLSACAPDFATRDHAAAVELACTVSGLRDHSLVAVRVHTVDGDAGVAQAQAVPHADSWHRDPQHHVKLEFVYSSSKRQLCIRILDDLSACDGVTAVSTAWLPSAPVCDGSP